MNRPRRNRLVHLLALALAATAVPLALPAPPAGATTGCVDGVQWTGAAGYRDWRDAANWVDGSGVHRVPGAADRACVPTGDTGPLVLPDTTLAHLELTGDPAGRALPVGNHVTIGELSGTGRIRFVGPTTVTDAWVDGIRLEVATPSVSVIATIHASRNVASLVDVEGTLHVGSAAFHDVTVHAGGAIDAHIDQPSTTPGLALLGDIDVEVGGRFAGKGIDELDTASSARLLGGPLDLVDVDGLDHQAPFPLTVRGHLSAASIASGTTVYLRPEGSRLELVPNPWTGSPLPVGGTLDVQGTPSTDGGGLPIGTIRVPITNSGTVRLDSVRLYAPFENRAGATTSVRNFVATTGPEAFTNDGRLEVGPRLGVVGWLGGSFWASGPLVNHGTIVATDPTAQISAFQYSGGGTVDAELDVLSGSPAGGVQLAPTEDLGVSVLGLAISRLTFGLAGLADSASSRVAVGRALVDFGSTISLDAAVGSGFVPCAGSRWQLVSWPKLLVGWRAPSADPSGDVPGYVRQVPTLSASGLPSGVTLSLRERADGWVAVASGAPSGGASCSDPVGRRLVSGWFVDGNGRPATAAEVARLGDRAASASGRVAVAREVLRTPAATSRFVAGELRRILGRPGSAANVAAYSARVQAGTATPDVVRAEVYGDSAFWAASGKTVDGWAKAFYRSELGRVPTAAELGVVRGQLAPGHLTRRVVAQYLLAGAEFDRALAGRSISLWWDRPSTAAERSRWATRYASGAELRVTADLAAADPIS